MARCPRCGGCLAWEHAGDTDAWEGGWRCINCGDCADPVVWQNRRERVAMEQLRAVLDTTEVRI